MIMNSIIGVVLILPFLLFFPQVLAEENVVTQTPNVAWHPKGEPAEMKCSHNKDATYFQMYWYRQRQGESMELIVYTATSGDPEFGSVNKTKFSTVKKIAANGSLTVKDLDTEDNAVYFCAVKGQNTGTQAYFGDGTKLTVLEPGHEITAPTVRVLNVSDSEVCTKENVTLVCVAEGFYPDHVNVYWTVNEENRTSDVSTDEAATKKDKFYSISSRLNIGYKYEWTKGKRFTCTVQFFNGSVYSDHSNYIEGPKIAGDEDYIEKYVRSVNTIMMAYGMFIAKSIAYGLFILYIIKRQGFMSK